jgi:hypothetical protein
MFGRITCGQSCRLSGRDHSAGSHLAPASHRPTTVSARGAVLAPSSYSGSRCPPLRCRQPRATSVFGPDRAGLSICRQPVRATPLNRRRPEALEGTSGRRQGPVPARRVLLHARQPATRPVAPLAGQAAERTRVCRPLALGETAYTAPIARRSSSVHSGEQQQQDRSGDSEAHRPAPEDVHSSPPAKGEQRNHADEESLGHAPRPR